MKKLLSFLTLSIFLFVSCEKEDDPIIDLNAEKQLPKVEVCHYDEYTDTWTTIRISQNALKAHMAHGDFEGNCEETKTYVPDDHFELQLLNDGLDDVFDDYVLTRNIINVKTLRVGGILTDCQGGFIDNCSDGDLFLQDLTGLEDFRSLEEFIIDDSYLLTSVNLENNTKLKSLYLSLITNLTEIDLSNNSELNNLRLFGLSHLTTLDLSKNKKLISLEMDVLNNLTELNLKNDNNNAILTFSIQSAPNLSCIQVDNPTWSFNNSDWINETNAIYSADCGY